MLMHSLSTRRVCTARRAPEAAAAAVVVTAVAAVAVTVVVAAVYIVLSRFLISLFNQNPLIIGYGARLLISQVILFPAFGLCYMMTITFQTISGTPGTGCSFPSSGRGCFTGLCSCCCPACWG